MPVFHIVEGKFKKLSLLPLDKEKALQKLVEENLLQVLDMHFLASEYITTGGGRIDTLAIDDSGAPVIIEYKRDKNNNVITQALFYLNWLKSQKAEFFEMLVIKKLGHEKAIQIDWKNPRVICIAESYNPYDIFALNEISANLELYRYRYYENYIFTLENIKGEDEKPRLTGKIIVETPIVNPKEKNTEIGLETHLSKGQLFVKELFFKIQSRIFELDENIQEKSTSAYIGYKVSNLFAEIHIQRNGILFHLRPVVYVDPREKTSKVPDSHRWKLNTKAYLDNENDIEYYMGLIEQSYKDVL